MKEERESDGRSRRKLNEDGHLSERGGCSFFLAKGPFSHIIGWKW